MTPCKRIEIVVERSRMRPLAEALEGQGVTDYTVILNAGGSGDRGPRRADDVTDTDENCVFIIATDDESEVGRITACVGPVLKRYGGLCLVSDASRLEV